MSVVLRFDGINDYAQFASAIASITNGYVEIKFGISSLDSDSFIRLLSDTTTSTTVKDRIILEANGNRVIVNSGGGTNATWSSVFGSALFVGQVITLRVEATGTTAKRLYVNGVDKGTANTDWVSLGRWLYIGVNFSQYGGFDLHHLSVVDSDNSANSIYLSPDASSHGTGTPIVVDTLNGNNATGFNMATDGSVWVSIGSSAQDLTAATSQQVENSGISALQNNASLSIVTHQQFSDVVLSAVTQLNELSASQHEQHSDLVVNQISASISLSAVISEQAEDAQQSILFDAGSQQLQAIICEQIDDVSAIALSHDYLLTCAYSEQVSTSALLNVDSSYSITIDVLYAEQLSHAVQTNLSALSYAEQNDSEQQSQSITVSISAWLELDNSPVEQLSHANILSIINVGNTFDFTPHKLTIELVSELIQIERKTALTIVTRV